MPPEPDPTARTPAPRTLSRPQRLALRLLGHSDRGRRRLPWAFVLFLLVGLAVHTYAWVLFAAEWRTLHRYAETTCTVVEARLREFAGDPGRRTTYRPDVRIRYAVGGREYEAWTYDTARIASDDPSAARAALDRFEPRGRYPCWYDPADPSRVVVVRGHARFTWVFLAATGACVLLAIASLIHGWRKG